MQPQIVQATLAGVINNNEGAGEGSQDNLRLHRMPLEQAKRVAEAAGYKLQAESSLLANPRDRHRRPVFDPMLARNTDRFLLRFQP